MNIEKITEKSVKLFVVSTIIIILTSIITPLILFYFSLLAIEYNRVDKFANIYHITTELSYIIFIISYIFMYQIINTL